MNTTLKLTRPDGAPIDNWESWTRPKKDYQWKPGRSAMEFAKAWFRDGALSAPAELKQLLDSSVQLDDLKLLKGIPERVTGLPESGEGRNHDLWLLGNSNKGHVTICVEAKADEPFGNDTVSSYNESALKRRERGDSTKIPERIEQLLSLMPGDSVQWDDVRYQLLAAMCGTVIQAKRDGSSLAVFVVHEFHTERTEVAKIAVNAEEFDRFMSVLGGWETPVQIGRLYGPVMIDGIACLIGKVTT